MGLTHPPVKWVMCLSSGLKQPRREVDQQFLSSAVVKERVELYFYSPSGPSWSVPGWALYLRFYLFSQATFKNLEARGVHTQYCCELTASSKALKLHEWISGKVFCRSRAYELKFSFVSFRISKVLILINKWTKKFISPTLSWSLSKQKNWLLEFLSTDINVLTFCPLLFPTSGFYLLFTSTSRPNNSLHFLSGVGFYNFNASA
jgi:hypothetical protein